MLVIDVHTQEKEKQKREFFTCLVRSSLQIFFIFL